MVTGQLSVLSVSLLSYRTDRKLAPRSASEKELLFVRLRVRKITVFIKGAKKMY
jgi:hypothetical protein